MNQKQRARERAKKLGISYGQSLNMYRPHKPPQIAEKEETYSICIEDKEHEAYLARKTERILTEDERRRNAIIDRREAEDRELRAEELRKADIPQRIKGDF